MKVAVIGGGIFGCTAAIHLARAGHETHLFEKADALMQAASAINQFRLHRGYHYPRSPETGRECREACASFREEYDGAILPLRTGQFYAIAREGSKTSAEDYRAFLDRSGLAYNEVAPDRAGLDGSSVDLTVEVVEGSLDPGKLHKLVEDKLTEAGVVVHLWSNPRNPPSRSDFDQIVIAAYANTNVVARQLGCKTTPLQFEICEKPVVRLSAQWRNTGVVVMDGPFCSIDPYGSSGFHVLGHVEHAIHGTKVGDSAFEELRTGPDRGGRLRGPACLSPSVTMNAGIIADPAISNYPRFVDAGSRFFPALKEAEYIGSMFTVRAVLPDKDATDERPTLVERLDDQVVRIFSGKIGTAVDAARQSLSMMEAKRVAA